MTQGLPRAVCSTGHSVVTRSSGSLVVPEIARRRVPVRYHDETIDTAALGDRGIDIGFQRHFLAAAQDRR